METIDYKKIGFMCGLEVHQRLASSSKLFCACLAEADSEQDYGSKVERMQRAVAGEMGAVDYSSEFEEKKERKFTYYTYKSKSCLVDVDEEPPHELNREALVVSVAIAKSMGMRIVDEFQVMRKGVVDGSDPSAFQRTLMVALDGKINVGKEKISIPTMFLEEESSGIIKGTTTMVEYATDRLGIPLVEIDTDPYIPSPKAAKEVALYIGTLLRLTGMVQRGIGSIRQDVNMSIKGGARVEIKGMQELDLIDKFIDNEIARQQALILIAKELSANKAKVGHVKEVTMLFKNSKSKIIANKQSIYALALFGFDKILGREINPNRRLGSEISDYAKMAGVKGIIHSDEDMQKYQISTDEILSLKESLGINAEGSFILIAADSHEIAKRAIELAKWRAEHAILGVPRETRAVFDIVNATTSFLRPLPGGARMYPETDVRPVCLTDKEVAYAEEIAPNIEKEREHLKSVIKSDELSDRLLRSPRLRLFKIIEKNTNADREFIANTLLQKFVELRRMGVNVDEINDRQWIEIFKCYALRSVTKQAVEELIKIAASTGAVNIQDKVRELNLQRISGRALKELVLKAQKGTLKGTIIKEVMQKYRNVVDGEELSEIIKDLP